jgi:SAM-dependent methyltransferase
MRAGQHEIMWQLEDAHWWYGVRNEMVLRMLRERVPAGRRVLDAGCGTGGVLHRLGEWEAHGCDISAEAVRLCRARGLGRVAVCDVQAMPYADGAFDVVLSLDVLYHARVEEEAALREMRRVLAPGGLLLVHVPAFECLRGMHDEAVEGARRYSRSRLRALLQAGGFEAGEASYWNAWLFIPLLLRRRFSRDEQGDLRMPPAWLNRLLAQAGALEARLCRRTRFPLGSSLFAAARLLPASGPDDWWRCT